MKHAYKLTIVVVSLILFSCASQKPASGGAKDLVSPKVIEESPENNTTNFYLDQFTITFDERVQTNNLDGNIIVTPASENISFKSAFKKDKLTISWDKSLDTNTTYTFYLDNCVQDVTERNKLKQLSYTLSTGNVIDSNAIIGNAKIEFDNKPFEKALVGLYPPNDTLNVKKQKPLYYTYTDSEGKFLIKNLPEQNYNLFLIEDINKNLLYENNEQVSFLNEALRSDSNVSYQNLSVFKDDKVKPDIISSNNANNILSLKYDGQIESYRVTDTSFKTLDLPSLYLIKTKKLLVYSNSEQNIKIISVDQSKNIDTSDYKLEYVKDTLIKKVIKITTKQSFYKETDTLVFTANHLLNQIDVDSIKLTSDSTILDSFITHLSQNQLFISNIGKIGSKLTVLIKPGYVNTMNTNQINSFSLFSFQKYDKVNYGTLAGKVVGNKNKPVWVELLDNNNSILHTIRNTDFSFTDLTPGSYKIRVKVDENNNGQWDVGNYDRQQLPEKIVFHNTPFDVKANWEIQDIKIELY